MNNLGLKVPAQPGYINWPTGNQDRILRYKVHFFIKKYSVRRFCMVIRFFNPATTANDLQLRRISIPDVIHFIFSYLNSWERASISYCWVLNKETTGTIFVTSLVWSGPWLGIELGTSHTLSQHSTTRLSRGLNPRPPAF